MPMKALDTTFFALALFAVPALGWFAGRAMGRRDWPVGRVLVAGCAITATLYGLKLAILALAGAQPFWDALQRQVLRSFDNPEAGMFLVTLGVFMTMLGWTATPVAGPRFGTSSGTGPQ